MQGQTYLDSNHFNERCMLYLTIATLLFTKLFHITNQDICCHIIGKIFHASLDQRSSFSQHRHRYFLQALLYLSSSFALVVITVEHLRSSCEGDLLRTTSYPFRAKFQRTINTKLEVEKYLFLRSFFGQWCEMGDIWKPNASSKLRIKKRNSFPGKMLIDVPTSPLSNILGSRRRKTVGTSKRKNPFQCESNKMKCTKYDERTSENKENEFSNFRITRDKLGCMLKSDHQGFETELNFENNNSKPGTLQNDIKGHHQRNSEGFPTDWSLKTKVKFKSDRPFSWCTKLKSSLSSKGIVNFVRCVNTLSSDGTVDEDEKFRVDFRKNLSFWRHPNLPCIPNFPLSNDENHIILEKSFTNICKDVAIRENVMTTWTHSFQSVFTLARCGYCPYFYMCSQKFSCLFIGADVLGKEMIAIVTPTTKGLRELLHKEGEFALVILVVFKPALLTIRILCFIY